MRMKPMIPIIHFLNRVSMICSRTRAPNDTIECMHKYAVLAGWSAIAEAIREMGITVEQERFSLINALLFT